MLREIATKGWDADLSTSVKDERTPLIVLSKFLHNQPDDKAQESAYKIYKHLFFSFVFFVREGWETDLLTTIENVSFSVADPSSNVTTMIASASLQNWVEAISFSSNPNTSPEVLVLLNQVQSYFEEHDLAFLFKGLIKKPQKIGFILEQRK